MIYEFEIKPQSYNNCSGAVIELLWSLYV